MGPLAKGSFTELSGCPTQWCFKGAGAPRGQPHTRCKFGASAKAMVCIPLDMYNAMVQIALPADDALCCIMLQSIGVYVMGKLACGTGTHIPSQRQRVSCHRLQTQG